jgi:hypothetical protein
LKTDEADHRESPDHEHPDANRTEAGLGTECRRGQTGIGQRHDVRAPPGESPCADSRRHHLQGRLVESAVGAHLANAAAAGICELFYWRHVNREVDFVVRAGRRLTAIEVKSGRVRDALPGMQAFRESFGSVRTLLVGGDGLPLGEFLLTPVERLLGK